MLIYLNNTGIEINTDNQIDSLLIPKYIKDILCSSFSKIF
jgi:hypothetical protein